MISKILVADDHELFRETLVSALCDYFPKSTFIEADSGEEVTELLKESIPDIIILDIDMPLMNGFETLRFLKNNQVSSKVLMLTAKKAREFVFTSKQYGANGFLTKNTSLETLAEVIQRIITTDLFICSEWFSLDFNSKDRFTKDILSRLNLLTKREHEVLKLFFNGLNTAEVADKINIRRKSVDNYKNRIMSKLNVSEDVYFLDWVMKNREVLRYII